MNQLNGFQLSGQFPIVLTPEFIPAQMNEFEQLIKQNVSTLKNLLLKHGALLFRGFPVRSADDLTQTIEALGLGHFVNYIGGDSPRDKIAKRVYTSTEAPPLFHIPLHQELSFVKRHPRHIYFYCDTAAPSGGATIIGNARHIYEAIDPEVKQEFINRSLRYTARYYRDSQIMRLLNRYQRSHKSWPEVFETESKDELERKCFENDFNFKWLRNDWVQIEQIRPAIMTHPITHEPVWFNQAHLYDFNPRMLGWKNYIGAKIFYARKETRLHEIHFADGGKIPRAYLYHIMDVLNQHTVAYPWQRGDIMVLDNVLAMHGREPFSGPRRILTALTA